MKTKPATGETYPKSDLFNKAIPGATVPFERERLRFLFCAPHLDFPLSGILSHGDKFWRDGERRAVQWRFCFRLVHDGFDSLWRGCQFFAVVVCITTELRQTFFVVEALLPFRSSTIHCASSLCCFTLCCACTTVSCHHIGNCAHHTSEVFTRDFRVMWHPYMGMLAPSISVPDITTDIVFLAIN
ncbi:hypothetical protein BvCmsSIP019_03529 [Escherichia coli]|nr:hypothetical protein BvCmsSIP019_03529 [Escherichia coli]